MTNLTLKTSMIHDLSLAKSGIALFAAKDSGIWTDCGSEGCCQGNSDTPKEVE